MEISSHIYYRHPNSDIHALFDQLFSNVNGNEADFLALSTSISPQTGADIAQTLIESVDSVIHDLGAETIEHQAGYSIAHFCHGSDGNDLVEIIVQFIQDLSPDIHVQAWASGDDDPWEFWLKFENGKLIRQDDEPLDDPDEDEIIYETIYTWWHKDMPSEIKEGFLNDEHEEEDF